MVNCVLKAVVIPVVMQVRNVRMHRLTFSLAIRYGDWIGEEYVLVMVV